MQAKAILEAAVNVGKRGVVALPHIMVPLVGFEEELAHQVRVIRAAADQVFSAAGTKVDYKVSERAWAGAGGQRPAGGGRGAGVPGCTG